MEIIERCCVTGYITAGFLSLLLRQLHTSASQVMIHLSKGLPLTAVFPKKVNLTSFVYKSRDWGPFSTPTSFKPFEHDLRECGFSDSSSGCATECVLEMFLFLFPFGPHEQLKPQRHGRSAPGEKRRVNVHQLRMWECWRDVYKIITSARARSQNRKDTHRYSKHVVVMVQPWTCRQIYY